MLGSSQEPLCSAYDLAMLDLDGVVYVSGDAVTGAPEHLARVRAAGMRLAFVTNNASRPAQTVADHLVELGVEASATDVVTSAQAAARLLVDKHGEGARIMLLGAEGLASALRAERLEPVPVSAEDAVAIVTGYGPEVPWGDIMHAAVLIRDGLPWVATNTDVTIPTTYGVAPGHGVLVQMLVAFARVTPVVAGKPERPLLDETVRRVGGRRPLMVGDRLDTDIEGARNAGYDSLLVLTGVTGLADLVAAEPRLRPTYVAPDLAGLMAPHAAPEEREGGYVLAGWTARVEAGRLEVTGEGEPGDWWRVVAAAAWSHLDEAGEPISVEGIDAPGTARDGRAG